MDNITKPAAHAITALPAACPTGSGKTFVMGQVLQRVGEQRNVLVLVCALVTLVGQTLDSLLQHASGLSPVLFSQGRNQDLGAGTVLISTAQGVGAPNGAPKATTPMPTTMCAPWRPWWPALVPGLQIGLVVDEAHIGLDKVPSSASLPTGCRRTTLLMATATPGPTSDRLPGTMPATAGRSTFGQPG